MAVVPEPAGVGVPSLVPVVPRPVGATAIGSVLNASRLTVGHVGEVAEVDDDSRRGRRRVHVTHVRHLREEVADGHAEMSKGVSDGNADTHQRGVRRRVVQFPLGLDEDTAADPHLQSTVRKKYEIMNELNASKPTEPLLLK